MNCPACNCKYSTEIHSQHVEDTNEIHRSLQCVQCKNIFTTTERIIKETVNPPEGENDR